MDKKEQRELIKKQLLNQKDEVGTDTIIIGSASKVTVVKEVYGIWKQKKYPASHVDAKYRANFNIK